MLYVFCQKLIKSSLHAVLKKFLWKKLFRKNHRLPDKMMTWRETERTNAIHKNSQNTLIASRDHRAGICVAARNALPCLFLSILMIKIFLRSSVASKHPRFLQLSRTFKNFFFNYEKKFGALSAPTKKKTWYKLCTFSLFYLHFKAKQWKNT